MIPKPAQYLLRFDDLCPTVSRARWERFLPLIEEFGIRPILAVIPDNLDHSLELSPPGHIKRNLQRIHRQHRGHHGRVARSKRPMLQGNPDH